MIVGGFSLSKMDTWRYRMVLKRKESRLPSDCQTRVQKDVKSWLLEISLKGNVAVSEVVIAAWTKNIWSCGTRAGLCWGTRRPPFSFPLPKLESTTKVICLSSDNDVASSCQRLLLAFDCQRLLLASAATVSNRSVNCYHHCMHQHCLHSSPSPTVNQHSRCLLLASDGH
ncbi:hypothetical protein L1887_21296 [Cichorium endivia]|nr:hypothetical protein L1887_21296 [Cichorium endivia]